MATVPDTVSSALRTNLLAFFDAHARDLPWRETSDPYGVWVSEIMLQQTQVATVVPYYERWMRRFPSVEALAAAPLDSVLEAWSGLGYYSRARNLHRAASVVRERHDGRVPDDVESLKQLPGVGDYTAGAVASIAFRLRAPAVDGNVRRVLSRLFDIETPTPAVLAAYAAELVDPVRPGDFNQALMELGATVCKPRNPQCADCPVVPHCVAFAKGTVSERPLPRKSKPVPTEIHVVVVPRLAIDGVPWTLLRRRPTSGLLGGMLEFPSVGVPSSGVPPSASGSYEPLARTLLGNLAKGVSRSATPLEPVRHRFSHLEITYHPFLFDLDVPAGVEANAHEEGVFRVAWSELAASALSAAQRRIAGAAEQIGFTGR